MPVKDKEGWQRPPLNQAPQAALLQLTHPEQGQNCPHTGTLLASKQQVRRTHMAKAVVGADQEDPCWEEGSN